MPLSVGHFNGAVAGDVVIQAAGLIEESGANQRTVCGNFISVGNTLPKLSAAVEIQMVVGSFEETGIIAAWGYINKRNVFSDFSEMLAMVGGIGKYSLKSIILWRVHDTSVANG